jgi:hypothetical protein
MNSIKYNDYNIQIDDFEPKYLRYSKKISDKCGYGGNSFVYDGICFFITKENEHFFCILIQIQEMIQLYFMI